MDQNGDLFKGFANKLQSVIDKEETSDPTSNHQRCLPLNRRSSEESEDQISTNTPSTLVSSGVRLHSYPSSSCTNSSEDSRPESSPDKPTASTSKNPCSNWTKVRNSLNKITLAHPSTKSAKPTRKKIFKKKVSKRVVSDSPSTTSSESFESLSTSDQSPEPELPLSELHGNVGESFDPDSQTPKLKRKRSLEGSLPLRKTRRFNSLDESLATTNRLSSKHDGHQVEKRLSLGAVQSISDVENYQDKKPLKRRNSLNENFQP